MSRTFWLTFGAVIYIATSSVAHAVGTSGLVDGIWFSQDPVTNFGETTVYSVIHNQTDERLQGIVTLIVDDEVVGAQEVSVSAGDIQKVNITHTFLPGTHTVGMSFTAGNGADVTLPELAARSVFVVIDTDGDGVQDTTDPDDDNDGILDTEDAEPLVRNALPRSQVDLRKTGRDFLARITESFGSDSDMTGAQEETTETVAAAEPGAIAAVINNLEDARKRGAAAMREREEVRRKALEEITRVEESLPVVEGFEPPVVDESKKIEHQIAAAGAATLGTMLDKGWLFYSEILVLTLGAVHILWAWFRKRFANTGIEDE
jgi:hypothetical protein